MVSLHYAVQNGIDNRGISHPGIPVFNVRCETGQLREQVIEVAQSQAPWRRIELKLDQPTDSGECVLWLWSNLPETISAG